MTQYFAEKMFCQDNIWLSQHLANRMFGGHNINWSTQYLADTRFEGYILPTQGLGNTTFYLESNCLTQHLACTTFG